MHTAYEWWSDIWLPALGAILIPLAIAFFTWWFGASRYEKNKELKNLNENLNFLISILLPSLVSLSQLKKQIEHIKQKEDATLKLITNNIDSGNLTFDDVCRSFLFENMLQYLNITNYTSLTQYDEDFIANIATLRSIGAILENMIKHRNDVIGSIAGCENYETKINRCLSFLQQDYNDLDKFLYKISSLMRIINTIFQSTKNLKIKGLKLIKLGYDEYMKKDIQWALTLEKKEGKA